MIPAFNTYIYINNLVVYTLLTYLMDAFCLTAKISSRPLSIGYSLSSSFGAIVFYSYDSFCNIFLFRRPGTLFLDQCKWDMNAFVNDNTYIIAVVSILVILLSAFAISC